MPIRSPTENSRPPILTPSSSTHRLEQLQGRVPAQHLLHRRRRGNLAAGHARPLLGVGQHRAHPVTERVDRRLVAGVEQNDDRADDLVESQSVALVGDADKFGDQITFGLLPAGGDQGVHVADELGGGQLGRLPLVVAGGELVHLHDCV